MALIVVCDECGSKNVKSLGNGLYQCRDCHMITLVQSQIPESRGRVLGEGRRGY